jgi:hypothetical protein
MTIFSNSRRNPIQPTAISWRQMDDEFHVIAEFAELPGIYGIELQDLPNPNAIAIYEDDSGYTTGSFTGLTEFTKIISGLPAVGQFRVGSGYSTKVIFNAADDGKTVIVDYEGGGTGITLDNVQDLINVGSGIFSTPIQLVVGSISAPSLAPTGDLNTGLYFPATDQFGIVTGGQERFRADENGRLYNVYDNDVGTDYRTTLNPGWLCRGFVNFNGTGTPAIRAAGNISSITDHGTGEYSVNFTVAMPDTDYTVVSLVNLDAGVLRGPRTIIPITIGTSSYRFYAVNNSAVAEDMEFIGLGFFR